MTRPAHHLNGDGFPEIEREPVPMPELGEQPTWQELAGAYAQMAVGWYRQWGRLVDAVYWLRGAVMGAKGEAEAARKAAEAARATAAHALARAGLPVIDPESSYNDLSVEADKATAEIYALAKDPRNPLTMADGIALFREMLARARRDSERVKAQKAEERRVRWNERRWGIWLTVLGAILALIGELLLAHYHVIQP